MVENPTTKWMNPMSPNRYGPPRGSIDWVVVHTQEATSTAEQVTDNVLMNPNAQVSYNTVVGDRQTIEVVPPTHSPWAAANANTRADHLLFAGTFAAWTFDKWLSTDTTDGINESAMLTRGAIWTAWRCQERDIPVVWVGGTSTKPPARKGICGHVDLGAWGGGHTDPGNGFPRDEFMDRVRIAYNGEDPAWNAVMVEFTSFP